VCNLLRAGLRASGMAAVSPWRAAYSGWLGFGARMALSAMSSGRGCRLRCLLEDGVIPSPLHQPQGQGFLVLDSGEHIRRIGGKLAR